MDEQEPVRRIVSRGEYRDQVANKASATAFAWFFHAVAVLFEGLTLACVVEALFSPMALWCRLLCLACSIGMGWFTLRVYLIAQSSLAKAKAMKIGSLLTRANTADLPAEETLVRASAAPVEQQQTVLLRPASQTDKTPAEQLVRPAAMPE